MNLTAANEISVDAAVTAVLSELDGIFTLKEEQRMTLKAFFSEKDILSLLPTGFSKSLVKRQTFCILIYC